MNIDYHVELDKHYYSVPYTLRGEDVELRYTRNAGAYAARHTRDQSMYDSVPTSSGRRISGSSQMSYWIVVGGETEES